MNDSRDRAPDVKQHNGLPSPKAARLMRLATYMSVSVAAVLIIVKFVAWELTGSLSLLGALLDSILDAAASLVNLFAVRHALIPADKEHRFGHGKAEPLAALAQSAFVCGSALFLVIQSINRLLHPTAIESGTIGIAVMVFSIIATLALVGFQRYVVRQTGSLAIAADSLHYKGDLLMNLMVIIAIFLSVNFGLIQADPIIGLAIAAYIVWCAWQIAKDALQMLMDREIPDEDRARIGEIILGNEEVLAFHDLRTRASGPQIFIQCHIEMEGSVSLWKAHEVADRVEHQLETAFPGAEVILHEDPYLGAASSAPGRVEKPKSPS